MVRRKDKKGRVLKDGESQRKDGTYQYRWTDRYGKRHCVYGKTLEILRDKVEKFKRDSLDGIRRSNADLLSRLPLPQVNMDRMLKRTLENLNYLILQNQKLRGTIYIC